MSQTPVPRSPGSRASRVKAVGLGACALVVIGATGLLGACGDESASQSTGESASQTRQVLVQVERGDVTKSVAGTAELVAVGDTLTATVTVSGDGSSSVAEGQTVTVMLGVAGGPQGEGASPAPGMSPPTGADEGSPGGVPEDGGQGQPPSDQGGAGRPGNAGGISGTVTAVETSEDGDVVAAVTLEEVPDDAAVGDQGMASIVVDVLAEDVLVVPTGAVQTDDGAASVRIMVDGSAETREVEIGMEGDTLTEVLSGLREGDSIVYEIQMRRRQDGEGPDGGWPQGGQPAGAPAEGSGPDGGGEE